MNELAAIGKFSRVKPGDTECKTVDMPPATDKVPPVTPWK
jgi:hypothetical protein